MLNTLVMIAVVVAISTAAVERLMNPRPVLGEAVTLVALIGLLINLLVAWLLLRSQENINVRGALLHVLGDLLGSIAALISGVVITVTGWYPIDPILSLVIVILILFSSLRLLREGVALAARWGVPPTVDLPSVGTMLAKLEGIQEVHDLHIWSLSAERKALTAHLVVVDITEWPHQLAAARELLHRKFRIDHITLQPELRPMEQSLFQIQEPNQDGVTTHE